MCPLPRLASEAERKPSCRCSYRDNVSEEEESHGTSADQSSEAGYEEQTRLSSDEPVSPARRKIEKVRR